MTPFDLTDTYLIVGATTASQLEGGETFWAHLDSDDQLRNRVGEGWLVGRYPATTSWDSWEMHPDGDEIVHAVAGRMTLLIDTADDVQRVGLVAGQTVVVPAGAWHTIDVIEAGMTLHVTFGRGTEGRAR
jgi:mannose-6-phosphate isomerase-like protein (cupin superfamily)